jgi:hypothetical protein
VAGIVFLINNPKVVAEIGRVAGNIIGLLIKGLQRLPGVLADILRHAFSVGATAAQTVIKTLLTAIGNTIARIPGIFAAAFQTVIRIIRTIVGKAIGVIGGIITAVKNAIAWVQNLGGKINGIPVMPPIPGLPLPHFAQGGWAGLHGPELAIVGEKEPEYIVPRSKMVSGGGGTGGSGTFVAIPLSQTELENAVDRGLYFKLRRSAPTLARS